MEITKKELENLLKGNKFIFASSYVGDQEDLFIDSTKVATLYNRVELMRINCSLTKEYGKDKYDKKMLKETFELTTKEINYLYKLKEAEADTHWGNTLYFYKLNDIKLVKGVKYYG